MQVGPPKPPSPVPEGIEEEASPAKVASLKEDSGAPSEAYAQERSRLRSDLQKVCRLCAFISFRSACAQWLCQLHTMLHAMLVSCQIQCCTGMP